MFNQYEDYINRLVDSGIEESEAKKEISILESEIKDKEKIKSIIEKRIQTRTPIQYLIGKAYFMNFEVKVNNKVLIPRPETEILLEETVKRLICHCEERQRRSSPDRDCFVADAPRSDIITTLDIGTGSGIIAIALAKLIPDIKITAIDIDKEIINLAKENAKLNNVENKINFKICDVFSKCFEGLLQNQKFDLIISNPPYVKPDELQKLKPEVFIHEPKLALSGSKENKSGLVYYERIISVIARKGKALTKQSHNRDNKCEIASPASGRLAMTQGCLLAFEIDPPLVEDLKRILKENNLNNYEIVKDYAKLDRCLFVHY